MKRRGIIKSLLIGVTLCAVLAFGSACNLLTTQKEDQYTGFLEGVATKTPIAEMILLEEYIDYPADGESQVVITKGDYSKDVTGRATWTPDEAGTYTITHTVTGGKYAGVYKHELFVTSQVMKWVYSTDSLTLLYDTEVQFEDIFRSLNLAVDSAYDWTPFMQSVRIGDTTTEFTDETSYLVSSLDTHYFIFGVKAENGETLKSIATANIIFSEEAQDLYLGVATEGTHTIEVEGATAVTVNGETCSDATITPTGITFDKQVLRNKYKGTNFISITTPNGEIRETINVYTENFSFEGDYTLPPNFLTVHSANPLVETGSKRITTEFSTEGSKAIETTAPDYMWPSYIIQMEYLDMVFEDPEVLSLKVDVIYAGTTASHSWRNLTWLREEGDTSTITGIFANRNVPCVLTITREKYENLKSYGSPGFQLSLQNSRNAAGGYDQYAKVIFDHFRAVYPMDDGAVFVGENVTGSYDIAMSGVTDVKIDPGKYAVVIEQNDIFAVPEDKLTIMENKVSIDKAWLNDYVGTNELLITANGKTYLQMLNVYPSLYDFEDQITPNFILWLGSDSVTHNPHCYELNDSIVFRWHIGPTANPTIGIATSWLKDVFADETVKEITYDFTVQADADATYRQVRMHLATVVLKNYTLDETTKVTITREMYEAWLESDNYSETALIIEMDNRYNNIGGGNCKSVGFNFDNIRIVREGDTTDTDEPVGGTPDPDEPVGGTPDPDEPVGGIPDPDEPVSDNGETTGEALFPWIDGWGNKEN